MPNVNLDSYKIDDLTTEWREVEFTLQPKEGDLQRLKMSDVLFTCEDIGNLNKMFIFIDDMQVWQELHEGEVGRIMYTDNFIKDNIEATSLYFTTGDLLEGEQFAYAVCTYSLEAHSPESNMILVADGTGINKPAVSETTDASTPVTVYNLSGSVVARGTVGNMPAMPKGALIVKTGSQVKKVIVK